MHAHICPLPRPARTIEEWATFTHRDLSQMRPDQLAAEARAVEQRIAHEAPRAAAWYFDRLAKVRALLSATQGMPR